MAVTQRIDADFLSKGKKCGGWLYLPDMKAKPPVVIMAHGFAAERTFRLPAFAEKFAEKGMAVFLFDFRNIGSSEGEPRNLVNFSRQIQDWEAAIAHVRSLLQIDSSRIALWGSSFSGGEVIKMAARDTKIIAIIAQVPHVDPWSSSSIMGLRFAIRLLLASMRDISRIITFRKPYCIPVVGDPGNIAVMNTPEAKRGYLSMIPESSTWKNETPARSILSPMLSRPPIMSAKQVKCPALIVMAEQDSIISPKALEKTASKMERATLARFPVGHFGVYTGQTFEEVVNIEVDFLAKHLIGGKSI
jgi:alpha-beta hydrolase superfamily lysophospholipase